MCQPYGMEDRSTGQHIASWIWREYFGQSVDLMNWVSGQQVDILSHGYMEYLVDLMEWVHVEILSHGYVANILVNVSTLWCM